MTVGKSWRAAILAATASTALFATAAPAIAQERPIAFTGATILTMEGETIENGTVVIQGGKIKAVGDRVVPPPNAEFRNASGKVIMPGIVDTHSHIGQVQGADRSAPIQPEVRAMDYADLGPNVHSTLRIDDDEGLEERR